MRMERAVPFVNIVKHQYEAQTLLLMWQLESKIKTS
jgi:hypothetical protein